MKKLLVVLFILGCTSSETINQINVTINGVRDEAVLSRTITLPVSEEEAEFLNNESGCLCSGELILINNSWRTSCCNDYPDCRVIIDRSSGSVYCEQYG